MEVERLESRQAADEPQAMISDSADLHLHFSESGTSGQLIEGLAIDHSDVIGEGLTEPISSNLQTF
jgi:hypothetical protein